MCVDPRALSALEQYNRRAWELLRLKVIEPYGLEKLSSPTQLPKELNDRIIYLRSRKEQAPVEWDDKTLILINEVFIYHAVRMHRPKVPAFRMKYCGSLPSCADIPAEMAVSQ